MTASTRTTTTIAELPSLKGQELGTSDWFEVTQDRVNTFADATDDHQWIHVDPERAAKGPFGTTIAHGYLTLSLLPALMRGLVSIDDARMVVNYGLDSLRLTAPVPVGSRVRAKGRLLDAREKGGGVLYRTHVEVEIEGTDRPALVATVLLLVYA